MISTEILRFLLSPIASAAGSVSGSVSGSGYTTVSTSASALECDMSIQGSSSSSSGGGYTPHRRGRWYDRLCINLERYVAHNATKRDGDVDGDGDGDGDATGVNTITGTGTDTDTEAGQVQSAAIQLCHQYLLNSGCDPYVEVCLSSHVSSYVCVLLCVSIGVVLGYMSVCVCGCLSV